jgi:hypothetical protein
MDVAKEIESLREALDDLKRELTEVRKEGKDTKIAELFIMTIPSKLQYAEVSYDRKDIDNVRKLLEKAKEELESSEKI